MAATTAIDWTNATFNPWIGCTKVAPGCTNCYAEADMDLRRHRVKWGSQGTRSRTSDDYWRQPLRWNRKAAGARKRRRVFCASLADVFEDWNGPIVDTNGHILYKPRGNHVHDGHDPYPLTMSDLRCDLFALIDQTPNLDWLLLTKRPQNVRGMWPRVDQLGDQGWMPRRIKNIWLGCSISDQATADAAISELMLCRDLCPVLFVSAEPLLGPIDFLWTRSLSTAERNACYDAATARTRSPTAFDDAYAEQVVRGQKCLFDWLIIGGESGRNARPCKDAWIRHLVAQCRDAAVACFVKQLGANVLCELESTDDGWPEMTIADVKGRWSPCELKNPKGGDPSEWPEDLRVREFPMNQCESFSAELCL